MRVSDETLQSPEVADSVLPDPARASEGRAVVLPPERLLTGRADAEELDGRLGEFGDTI